MRSGTESTKTIQPELRWRWRRSQGGHWEGEGLKPTAGRGLEVSLTAYVFPLTLFSSLESYLGKSTYCRNQRMANVVLHPDV